MIDSFAHDLGRQKSTELYCVEADSISKIPVDLHELTTTGATISTTKSIACSLKTNSSTPIYKIEMFYRLSENDHANKKVYKPTKPSGYVSVELLITNMVGRVIGAHDGNLATTFIIGLQKSEMVFMKFRRLFLTELDFQFSNSLYQITKFCRESTHFWLSSLGLVITNFNESTRYRICGNFEMAAFIVRESLFFEIELTKRGKRGFSLVYSVLESYQEPIEMTPGVYNCSTSNFENFKNVLRCNMIRECYHGEDEMECDYQGSQCDRG